MSATAEIAPPTPPHDQGKLRLMVLSRKFWPYSGAAEQQAADLAMALSQQGHTVDVLTVCWNRSWPTFFRLQQTNVHRLPRPNAGPWGAYRYSKSLTRQIVEQAPDGIFVFGLSHELTTVHRQFGDQVPYVVVLTELDFGVHRDSPKLNHRQVKALLAADAVVCESAWTRERLEQFIGLDPEQILVGLDGVTSQPRKADAIQRSVMRRAFADVHPMLVVPEGQALVACFSPFVGDPGLIQLVDAWRYIFSRNPNTKLWLIGEGPRSREVWDAVVEAQLTESVILPGEFDLIEDVALAADLIIHNLHSDLYCTQFLRGFLNGSAAIVRQSMAEMMQLQHQDAVVIQDPTLSELADTIQNLLFDSGHRELLAENAAKHAPRFQMSDRVAKILGPIYAASRQ